jgi:hypothetical protein
MARLLRFLNRNPYSIIIVLFIGVFGIIITELPDMYPDSNLISIPPHLASLDAGLADLTRFDEVDANDKAISVLRDGDKGYAVIYRLLRIFDPSIPTLKEASANSPSQRMGIIVSTEEIKWSNPYGKIPIFRPVLLVEFQEPGLTPVPVCDMRDLAFLIHDQKARFWSRLGVTLALVALFLQTIPALSIATRSSQQSSKEIEHQLETATSVDKQDADKKRTSTAFGRLLLAVSLGTVFGVLLSKVGRRGVRLLDR